MTGSSEDRPDRAGRDIDELLRDARAGDRGAFDEAYRVAYGELRRLAHAQRRRRARPGETLDTTALVHETYLRLAPRSSHRLSGREHFMAVAATAMRQILVDAARARLRQKRGGGAFIESLDDRPGDPAERDPMERDAETILSVHEALLDLRRSDERLHGIIECRFFGGMTQEETARSLDCSERTIRRDWIRARAWLRTRLGPEPQSTAPG